ncbi:hypothetical protein B0H10DRAFT_2219094 [Mycena sp. CBHHK59/15]|nr:hypothetical protein B0H10DRAFT_2219094 [Mycena sp. CBHHK59/15]
MTKLMRGTLNGLTQHLKSHAPEMHRFFEILKSRATPLTAEEVKIAEGRQILVDHQELVDFLDRYQEKRQQSLRESFARVNEKNLVRSLGSGEI